MPREREWTLAASPTAGKAVILSITWGAQKGSLPPCNMSTGVGRRDRPLPGFLGTMDATGDGEVSVATSRDHFRNSCHRSPITEGVTPPMS